MRREGGRRPQVLATRSLTRCTSTDKVISTDGHRTGYQSNSIIFWRHSEQPTNSFRHAFVSEYTKPATTTHPPQKPHVYRLPTPGWVPRKLLPSRPNMSLPPALLQSKDCRHIRPEELNRLCIHATLVGQLQRASVLPHQRDEGSTKTKRVVGQLRRASVLQHQTQ